MTWRDAATAYNRLWARMTEQLGAEKVETLLASDELAEYLAETFDMGVDLARELITVPPLALFYLLLATTALPLVVILTSSDAVSSEIASGSARYALFRSDRLGWALGKLAGQTLLMIVGVVIGAVAAFAVGAAMLDRFEAASTALWLLRMSGRAAIYGFAYLGVAMCASLLVRGNAAARGLGLMLVTFCWLGGTLLRVAVHRGAGDVVNALRQIFPNAHGDALFFPGLAERVPAMLALIAIGAAYFALGYARFARRDA